LTRLSEVSLSTMSDILAGGKTPADDESYCAGTTRFAAKDRSGVSAASAFDLAQDDRGTVTFLLLRREGGGMIRKGEATPWEDDGGRGSLTRLN
jgi:hypothetical protein